jgi:hypothetical protein
MTTLTARWRRGLITLVLLALLTPLGAPIAYAQFGTRQPPAAPRQGMSTKKKLLLLSGAALLYYMYKKHQANASNRLPSGQTTANGRTPQLYRSRNGGVYYRDAQGRPVWLTVPQQGIQVPYDEVQRYAPDYNQYRGPAPAAPSGYRTQPFSDFNGSLTNAAYPSGPRGPR